MKSYNLGPLETEVMDFLWVQKSSTVSDVQRFLKKKNHKIAYTTVMTIMGRLMRKGLLERELEGKAYLYSPKISRERSLKNVVERTVSSLIDQYGIEAVTAFTSEIKKHK